MEWGDIIKRILALTSDRSANFANQPYANRIDAILEAVVPSRKNPTHEKVLKILNALIDTGAIRPDEGGQVYSALLERVSRYNSTNVQTNLDRLSSDVREVLARKERNQSHNMGSLVALNGFLSSLPANVERGQDNYTAFISALKLLVTEVPQTEVYQAGPNYYLQTSRNGSHTVNLTQAFKNLSSIWGVEAPVAERTPISSLLTPNTRLLMLLIAPFTDGVNISRSSYIGHLLTLYREAIGRTNLDERTFNEITRVSESLGSAEDAPKLQQTLNFLLTNRQYKIPVNYSLTTEEERILRYVQQAVSMRIMAGLEPSVALDMTSRNFEPSFYSGNRIFINKLMDYFHRAAAVAPEYFLNAVLNPKWMPPEGFFTGVFDFPEVDDGYMWEDIDEAEMAGKDLDEFPISRPASVAGIAGAEAPAPIDASRWSSLESLLGMKTSNSKSNEPFDKLIRDEKKATSAPRNLNNDIESLVSRMSRWKTYAQENQDAQNAFGELYARRRHVSEEDDSRPNDRFLKFEGSGNPFGHLKPKGKYF